MSVQYSARDMDHLSRAVAIASKPFEYPTIDDWRANVMAATMPFFDGRMGHFDLFGLGLPRDHFFVGYPDGLFEDWTGQWSAADTAVSTSERFNLKVYSRRYRYRIAGEQWTAKYKRSAVYKEFYRKYDLGDASGIYFRRGGIRVHLLIETGEDVDDDVDERRRTFLGVLQPAIESSVLSIAQPSGGHWNADALLGALNEPIALVGADGEWLHRSGAFEASLEMMPADQRSQFVEATRRRAQHILRAQGTVATKARGAATGPAMPLWTESIFDVCATTIDLSGDRGACCLVKLSTRSATNLDQAAGAGLSKRESTVALCLADGMTNKAIARRLAISEHTARRHTENILRKLRISNRSSVASALRGTMPNASDTNQR